MRAFLTLLTVLLAVPAAAQDHARIVARGAGVEVFDAASQLVDPSGSLESGYMIRTAGQSFAVVEMAPDIRMTLGADSVARLESPEGGPSFRLEQGIVRLRTNDGSLRVWSPAGAFVVTEAPAEAEIEILQDGRVGVRVFSGGIVLEGVDPAQVVLRAPGDRPARVYSAGATDFGPDGPADTNPPGWRPNVYVGYPGVPYAIPGDGPGQRGPRRNSEPR